MSFTKQEKGYLGNPRLKRSGVQMSWTAAQIAEYVKCKDDPVYFIETYMKIVSVDEGLVPFKMYDFQKTMVRTMFFNRFTIINTARQVGKSTTTCGFILHQIIFNDEKTWAILANKAETAREILSRVQLAYEHLPKWLQHGVVEFNKGSFQLENGSRVLASATSSSAIRGYSLSGLMLDEAAFIEGWDDFFKSVYPTISSGKKSKLILVSTPNGMNHFYKVWEDSVRGRNKFRNVMVQWHQVPGRDEKWQQETISNTSEEQFLQEHCCVASPTMIRLRHKITGEIMEISIGEFWRLCAAERILHMETSSLKVTDYEVETPNGWSNFHGIRRTLGKSLVSVSREDGIITRCTTDHKFLTDSGWVEAKDLIVGSTHLQTATGFVRVSSLSLEPEEETFDLIEVELGHAYYTDGVVSHNCEFLGSSKTLISGYTLKNLVYQDPLATVEGARIFAKPEENHTYTMCVDVSHGKGIDKSAFTVIDITKFPYRTVATFYEDRINPVSYVQVIFNIARLFNDAFVLVENNDIGKQVVEILYYEYEYENTISTVNFGRAGKKPSFAGGTNAELGVKTTKTVKSVGCALLKALVEKNMLTIVDYNQILELSTFSKKGFSYEAESGCNDDLAMNLVLFAWMTDSEFFKDISSTNIRIGLKSINEDQMMEDLVPFGFVVDGTEDDRLSADELSGLLQDSYRDAPSITSHGYRRQQPNAIPGYDDDADEDDILTFMRMSNMSPNMSPKDFDSLMRQGGK